MVITPMYGFLFYICDYIFKKVSWHDENTVFDGAYL